MSELDAHGIHVRIKGRTLIGDDIPGSALSAIIAAVEKAHIIVNRHGTPAEYMEVSEALAALYEWRIHVFTRGIPGLNDHPHDWDDPANPTKDSAVRTCTICGREDK